MNMEVLLENFEKTNDFSRKSRGVIDKPKRPAMVIR